MLYKMNKPQSFLDSGEDYLCFTIYGPDAILFNNSEPFEQIDNIPEGPV